MLPRVVAIIQARMSSSRLPGKVMLDIGGKPMLQHVIERVRKARLVQDVVVATTIDSSDDAVETFCDQGKVYCFRGNLFDVLDRFYMAASAFRADVIVRITADCPLIDPAVIDETVARFLGGEPQAAAVSGLDVHVMPYDFAANRLPPPWKRTYPIGLDVEVCSYAALERAWKEASQPYQREHVMPYLYEKQGMFRVLVVDHDPDYGSLRWTVDTAEDLELVRKVFAHFGDQGHFSWLDIVELFQQNPAWGEINAEVSHKSAFDVDSRSKNPTS